jgi:hypothetical protein
MMTFPYIMESHKIPWFQSPPTRKSMIKRRCPFRIFFAQKEGNRIESLPAMNAPCRHLWVLMIGSMKILRHAWASQKKSYTKIVGWESYQLLNYIICTATTLLLVPPVLSIFHWIVFFRENLNRKQTGFYHFLYGGFRFQFSLKPIPYVQQKRRTPRPSQDSTSSALLSHKSLVMLIQLRRSVAFRAVFKW